MSQRKPTPRKIAQKSRYTIKDDVYRGCQQQNSSLSSLAPRTVGFNGFPSKERILHTTRSRPGTTTTQPNPTANKCRTKQTDYCTYGRIYTATKANASLSLFPSWSAEQTFVSIETSTFTFPDRREHEGEQQKKRDSYGSVRKWVLHSSSGPAKRLTNYSAAWQTTYPNPAQMHPRSRFLRHDKQERQVEPRCFHHLHNHGKRLPAIFYY